MRVGSHAGGALQGRGRMTLFPLLVLLLVVIMVLLLHLGSFRDGYLADSRSLCVPMRVGSHAGGALQGRGRMTLFPLLALLLVLSMVLLLLLLLLLLHLWCCCCCP